MKSFTIQEVTDERVYIVVEQDDGTSFGKIVPRSNLSGSQEDMLEQLEGIAVEESIRQSAPAANFNALKSKMGEAVQIRPKAERDAANALKYLARAQSGGRKQ